MEGVVVDHVFFTDVRYVDGDIRDPNRNLLSEIAPKFRNFLALRNFRGQTFQKLYARYHPCLAARRLEEFREDIPTATKLLRLIRSILGLILNFRD